MANILFESSVTQEFRFPKINSVRSTLRSLNTSLLIMNVCWDVFEHKNTTPLTKNIKWKQVVVLIIKLKISLKIFVNCTVVNILLTTTFHTDFLGLLEELFRSLGRFLSFQAYITIFCLISYQFPLTTYLIAKCCEGDIHRILGNTNKTN